MINQNGSVVPWGHGPWLTGVEMWRQTGCDCSFTSFSSITRLSPYSVYTTVDKEIAGPSHDTVLITCSAFSLGFLAKEASADS